MKIKDKIIVRVCGWVWILTWFGAIWSPIYKNELFLTGLFLLFIGIVHLPYSKKDKRLASK